MGKILVVDDEIDICILLTDQLHRLGFQASYCLTLRDANNKLSTTSYDLLFVDLNLPDGSGYDLIHTIRTKDNGTKIIVISAYEGERQKVLGVGASLYVSKPFTRNSIKEALLKLNFLNN